MAADREQRHTDLFRARAVELLAEVDAFKGQTDPPGTMESWNVRAQTLLTFEYLRRLPQALGEGDMGLDRELVEDVRRLRQEEQAAGRAVVEAKTALAERIKAHREAKARLDSALDEIATGSTGRGLLDAIHAKAEDGRPDPDPEPPVPAHGGKPRRREVRPAVSSPADKAQEPADASRAELLARVREAIDEEEGPAGDGTRTRICSRCRAGFGAAFGTCPSCAWNISRVAAEVLEDPGESAGAKTAGKSGGRKRKEVASCEH